MATKPCQMVHVSSKISERLHTGGVKSCSEMFKLDLSKSVNRPIASCHSLRSTQSIIFSSDNEVPMAALFCGGPFMRHPPTHDPRGCAIRRIRGTRKPNQLGCCRPHGTWHHKGGPVRAWPQQTPLIDCPAGTAMSAAPRCLLGLRNPRRAVARGSRRASVSYCECVITDVPTNVPTDAPTDAPAPAPTASPIDVPSDAPTNMPAFHPCVDGSHGCDVTSTMCTAANGNDNTYTCECLGGFVSTYDSASCSATAAPTSAPTSHPTPSLCDFDQEYRVSARGSNNNEIWHDFDCITKTDCDAATQYETVAATETSDRECFALLVCTADQHQTVAPTHNSGRTCAALTTCDPSLEYQSVGPTAVSDRNCTPLTACINLGSVQFQSVQATTAIDRVCTDIAGCGDTQIQVVGPSSTWQRGCTAVIPCDFLTQCESVPKTATTQPVCAHLNICTNVQYESAAPTRSTQRECLDYTACDISAEYSTGL
jgi:hypothetical protein